MIQLPKPSSGWFCIDRTEVTESAYQAFLSLNPSMADQPAECAGNTTYAPTCPFDPANAPNLPVVCIDWCDAYAFCKAVGKRLCGNIAGGSNPTSVSTDASMSAWYAACSRAGVRAFPYGDVYDPMACNGGDASVLSPANVATFPGCIGGYPDLYDMSGNVREWEDSCSGDLCMLRGGGWSDTASTSPHSLRCDSSGLVPRTTEDPATGFRCCADLP